MTEDERFYAMAHEARVWELQQKRKERAAPEVPRSGDDKLAPFWIVYALIALVLFVLVDL